MAGYTNAGKVVALSAVAGAAKFVSLHTGDPGSTGANELTGGTPTYAAQAATWATVTTDTLTLSNQPLFNVPGGVTVTHVAFKTAATGGDVLWSRPLPNSETYAGQGTYTLLSAAETMAS